MCLDNFNALDHEMKKVEKLLPWRMHKEEARMGQLTSSASPAAGKNGGGGKGHHCSPVSIESSDQRVIKKRINQVLSSSTTKLFFKAGWEAEDLGSKITASTPRILPIPSPFAVWLTQGKMHKVVASGPCFRWGRGPASDST